VLHQFRGHRAPVRDDAKVATSEDRGSRVLVDRDDRAGASGSAPSAAHNRSM
jgi:hypothetical protein